MNIDNFKLFCLVVDEGSMSQAARLSYLSQPAVTRQIRQLEDEYGTLLFERIEGRLVVTEAGHMLYPFAKAIIHDFHRSKEVISQALGERNAHLKVGATLTIGEFLLPRLLGQFKKQSPDIKLTLTIKNTPGILEDLYNEVIDIAMVEGAVEEKDFIVEKFSDDELILICHSDHPWKGQGQIAVEDLANERMIWREPGSGTRLIVEQTLKEQGVLSKLESYMEIGSTQAIKSAVEAGLGISILPRLTVSRELEYGRLHEVSMQGISMNRGLWVVKKPKRFLSDGVVSFADFIKSMG